MSDNEIGFKPKGKSLIFIKESELSKYVAEDKKAGKAEERIKEFSDDIRDDGKRNFSNKKK